MTPLNLAGIVASLALGSALLVSGGSAANNDLPEVQYEKNQTLFSPAPKYPAKERETHLDGEAVVIATVAADGSVAEVKVAESQPTAGFGIAAAETVSRWKFRPEAETGRHAPFIVRIHFEFIATSG